jgi:hypothetical protein
VPGGGGGERIGHGDLAVGPKAERRPTPAVTVSSSLAVGGRPVAAKACKIAWWTAFSNGSRDKARIRHAELIAQMVRNESCLPHLDVVEGPASAAKLTV